MKREVLFFSFACGILGYYGIPLENILRVIFGIIKKRRVRR